MSDTALEIPRRLNDPPRMFWWDLDLSLLVLACMLAGMIAGFFLSGCVIGIVVGTAYSRAKSGKHPAFALHLIYWYLPAAITALKSTPPSYLREMVG
jgi:conjugal transfer pilus assembly protein TraL